MSVISGLNYALARRYWLKRALEARRWLARQDGEPPIFPLRDVQHVMAALRRARRNGSWWAT
jgi:hypothetical protein